MVSLAYVGSRGTHLPSLNEPLNALDPSLLSLGTALYDEFQPGQTSLHGVPIPYAGWREQMTGCAPSLAQALLPFPQYCSQLQGINELAGKSLYNSLQAKAEKRFSGGTYLLVSYTLAQLKTSGSDTVQSGASAWAGRQRRDLPLREGPQLLAGLRRRDTRPLGGHGVRAARSARTRSGSRAAPRRRSWADGRSARSSDTRRRYRSSSGRASATCPASSGPAASRP